MLVATIIFAVFLAFFTIYAVVRIMAAERRNVVVAQAVISDIDVLLFGSSLIDDGCSYFPDWSACMLREFDVSIEGDLESYFRMSQRLSKVPPEERRSQASQIMQGNASSG